MKRRLTFIEALFMLSFLLMLSRGACLAFEQFEKPIEEAQVKEEFRNLQIPFITNRGQMDEDVQFYASISGGTIFITGTGELVYFFNKPFAKKGVVLREQFVNGSTTEISGLGRASTKVNVLQGNDPSEWRRNIPTFDAVTLGQVYEGIEVELRAYRDTVEKFFHVRPGANPNQIRLKTIGGHKPKVNAKGELEIETELGVVYLTAPVAYQMRGDVRKLVDVRYEVNERGYGFLVGTYNPEIELVIDPALHTTFLGGSGFDEADAIAFDSDGNVLIAGKTLSPDFPGISSGAVDNTFANGEVFIIKLNSTLTSIMIATFLGGSSTDGFTALPVAMAVDGTDNVFVTGVTKSSNFPGVGSGADSTFGGISDVYVAKLNASLSSVDATFLGGSEIDIGSGIVLDDLGRVYVTGTTFSADFSCIGSLANCSGVSPADITLGGDADAFVVRLGAGLGTITGATFLGGNEFENALDIALDSSNNVYVSGSTQSAHFPNVNSNSADNTFTGGGEGYIAKLNSQLSNILSATFLGGDKQSEWVSAIALNPAGDVYAAGLTSASIFPCLGESAQCAPNIVSADNTIAGIEAFIVRLDAGLGNILGATFLGGSKTDRAEDIAIDGSGNVYVGGFTTSKYFPGIDGGSADFIFSSLANPNIGGEGFIAKLDATLSSLLAATYLGGSDPASPDPIAGYDDWVHAIVPHSSGNIYVAGRAQSFDFPGIGPTSPDNNFAGGWEGYVAVLNSSLLNSAMIQLELLHEFLSDCFLCSPEAQQDLIDDVDKTIKKLSKKRTQKVENILREFIEKTERFINSGEIPDNEGRRFIALAEEILSEIPERRD